MSAIKFERVERDCDYNRDVRSGKVKDHPIYDWNILIDGVICAKFKPGVYKGYDIFDPDGFHLKVDDRRSWARRSDVAAKAQFEPMVREWLSKGLIPTPEQLTAAREKRQRDREAAEAQRLEEARIERIQRAAVDLYDALLDCLREHGGFTIKGECERKARAALAKADGVSLTTGERRDG